MKFILTLLFFLTVADVANAKTNLKEPVARVPIAQTVSSFLDDSNLQKIETLSDRINKLETELKVHTVSESYYQTGLAIQTGLFSSVIAFIGIAVSLIS